MEPFNADTNFTPEFHSVVSISLGQLVTTGFIDWDEPEWQWNYYSEDQFKRMTQKIEGRFFTREIGIIPAANWRRRFISFMNEIAPKYAILYSIVDDPDFDPLQVENEYFKRRNIFSEFPQTALGGKQDYASSGDDEEYQRIKDGDVIEKIGQLRTFNDIDVMILDELEVLFSSLISVNINYF